MSDDFAVDPHRPVLDPEAEPQARTRRELVEGQTSEAGLPQDWREHVRELRLENARRRKENPELRAQLAAASEQAEEAAAAQTAATARAEREASRLAAAQRRLKEFEAARLVREALREAAAKRSEGSAPVDLARAERMLARLPAPVDPEADLAVDDEGQVALEPAANERLQGLADELVDALCADARVAAPPVGACTSSQV